MSAHEKKVNSPMRDARHKAGISIEELAKRSGVTPMTIRGWELGNRSPTIRAAIEVANALGISIDEYVVGIKPGSGKVKKTKFEDES